MARSKTSFLAGRIDTNSVIHENHSMATRNVTVSLDEEVALWARLEAARRDTSVSRLLGDLLKERMVRESRYDRAMESALARGPFLASDGRYLSREEVHDRARVR
jgi:predicted DNA-binding ribbon-helix-helix protein